MIPLPCLTVQQIAESTVAPDFVFVDTRNWNEYRSGHLLNSLFLPVDVMDSGILSSYVRPEESICLVISEEMLRAAMSCCHRAGVSKISCWMNPSQLKEYQSDGNILNNIEEIRISELRERLGWADTQLLDVRRHEELVETGQIGCATNIELFEIPGRCSELPFDKNIHVYCRTANRSRFASAFLARKGYKVTHVGGGIVEWLAMGGPVSPVKE